MWEYFISWCGILINLYMIFSSFWYFYIWSWASRLNKKIDSSEGDVNKLSDHWELECRVAEAKTVRFELWFIENIVEKFNAYANSSKIFGLCYKLFSVLHFQKSHGLCIFGEYALMSTYFTIISVTCIEFTVN